jgi:hypothetical protein
MFQFKRFFYWRNNKNVKNAFLLKHKKNVINVYYIYAETDTAIRSSENEKMNNSLWCVTECRGWPRWVAVVLHVRLMEQSRVELWGRRGRWGRDRFMEERPRWNRYTRSGTCIKSSSSIEYRYRSSCFGHEIESHWIWSTHWAPILALYKLDARSKLQCIMPVRTKAHQNKSVSCDTDYHGGSVFSEEKYNEYP